MWLGNIFKPVSTFIFYRYTPKGNFHVSMNIISCPTSQNKIVYGSFVFAAYLGLNRILMWHDVPHLFKKFLKLFLVTCQYYVFSVFRRCQENLHWGGVGRMSIGRRNQSMCAL